MSAQALARAMNGTDEDTETPLVRSGVPAADCRVIKVLLMSVEDIGLDDSVRSSICRLRDFEGTIGAFAISDYRKHIRRGGKSHGRAQMEAVSRRHVRGLFPGDFGALVRQERYSVPL